MMKNQIYSHLLKNRDTIRSESGSAAKSISLDRFDGQLGLSTSSSTCPGQLAKEAWSALAEARKTEVLPVRMVEDGNLIKENVRLCIRALVKVI